MQYWLAYVDAIDTVFDPDLHCGLEHAAFGFEMIWGAGEIATITVTRAQSGWAVMAPGAKRHALVSESLTGDPADAVVVARGRIVGLPGDLFGATQTIEIECGEWDLFQVRDRSGAFHDGRLMQYCRLNLQAGPQTCWTMDDADPDDSNSYLLGRAATFYFDPSTLEVSTSHLVDGPLFNLSESHLHDGDVVPQASVVEWPTTRYRMQVRAEWDQQARGYCNIAPRMGGDIATLSPDFLETQKSALPDGLADIDLGTGWTLESSLVPLVFHTKTLPILDGRAGTIDYVAGPADALRHYYAHHRSRVSYHQWTWRFLSVLMRFEYAQQRVETIDLSLDVPIQGVPTVQIEEDLGETGTVDLVLEHYDGTLYPTEPWSPRHYDAGERVTHNGYSYECLESHDSLWFFQRPEGYVVWPVGHVPADWSPHPYWKSVDSLAPLQMHDADFAGSAAGQDVIAHCMMRLRKRAIERARCLEVVVTYALDASNAGITLHNRARVEVPWPGGSRAMIGKVTRIQKSWDADAGGKLQLTIAVSVGTGGDAETAAGHLAPYGTTPNYMWSYVGSDPGDPQVYGVEGDVEYIVDADPLRAPVDARRLRDPWYSVTGVRRFNPANVQLNKAVAAGAASRNPHRAIQRAPTQIRVAMRDLDGGVPFERVIAVAGEMLRTEMGIDLTGGEGL